MVFIKLTKINLGPQNAHLILLREKAVNTQIMIMPHAILPLLDSWSYIILFTSIFALLLVHNIFNLFKLLSLAEYSMLTLEAAIVLH